VQDAGYKLVGERRQDANPVLGFVRFVFSKRETTMVAVAALLTVLGLAFALFSLPQWTRVAVFGVAIVVGGVPVVRAAFQEVAQVRSLGINTLMVIAVIGAAFIGEWAEAAIVVVLFSLGEALEGYATEQARGALESLLDLAPPVALRLLPDGRTEEVPVEQVAVGELALVRPGDRVSVDGVVRAGRSAVDQSPITGESVPAEKIPGDEVFAGTINTTGALEVEVTRTADDNTLSRMVALVQEAQSHRAPVQRFIDRFARVYTPAVTIAAALVAAVPPLLFAQPFWGDRGWLMRALQMLVIACPCALVISTPVSLVSAMTNAARRGVLVKGGRTLEALSQVTTFAFDKTGTLTEGRPVVTDVIDVCTCEECEDECGLEHASALEIRSSHPLAEAVLAEAQARGISAPLAEDVNVLAGRGVEGTVNGVKVTVASHDHFDEHIPHPEDVCRLANQIASEGKTVILVQHGGKVCGLFGVADAARPASREVVATIKGQGIRTLMVTGDNAVAAQQIGHQVGIDAVRAKLLPEGKVRAIAELVAQGETVAMVGDGVNDAPALAQASVGIAMGGAGSDQAMETADVVLMGDDLSQLPFIVWLSRTTRSVVSMNIILALGIKAVVFALAAAGLASLWMAIVADVGASMAVILNGMRLRGMKARAI
jgi:Cd2+/Zn2+-exporting ATPase